MQEQNAVSIRLLEDRRYFADLVNGYFFSGEKIIKPEDVQELNPILYKIRKMAEGISAEVLIRDVAREVLVGIRVMVMSAESQSHIHYAMPVRVMDSESTFYVKQWKEIAKEHRRKKDLKDTDEFLSGFSKDDQLIPVVTLVVYFGEKEWDGPVRLHEMLDFSECTEYAKELVADYPIHLLDVRRYAGVENFHTDLQYIFGFLQNCSDGEKLRAYVNAHEDKFADMEENAYDLLSVTAGSEELKLIKEKMKKEERGIDMCRGIQMLMEESRQDGRQEGAQKMLNLVIRMTEAGESSLIPKLSEDKVLLERMYVKYQL